MYNVHLLIDGIKLAGNSRNRMYIIAFQIFLVHKSIFLCEIVPYKSFFLISFSEFLCFFRLFILKYAFFLFGVFYEDTKSEIITYSI